MRFKQRYGPRVFLDSRDLIQLLEYDDPVSPKELAAELTTRNAKIVLMATNVLELIPQSDSFDADRGRVVRLLAQLEMIPYAYLRLPAWYEELLAAHTAFEQNRDVQPIDPFVEAWWETVFVVPRFIAANVHPDLIAHLDAKRLSQVLDLPAAILQKFRSPSDEAADMDAALKSDREQFASRPGQLAVLTAALRSAFARWRWAEPTFGLQRFASYIRDTPAACPSWRLRIDLYDQYRLDPGRRPQTQDTIDLSHAESLPYVTHATLDRAWRTRCVQAFERLRKTGHVYPALTRVYASLREILESM